MLDTILAPSTRSFEWHPRWNRREQAGVFKDGEGNFFFAWFCPRGAVVRGFDHESKMSPFQTDPPEVAPEMFDGIPEALLGAIEEPAFSRNETTFCFWSPGRSGRWLAGRSKHDTGDETDGSAALLACFCDDFRRWACSFYGVELDDDALRRLWPERRPLDWDTLEALNVDFDERAVREEAELLDWEIDLSKRISTNSVRSGPLRLGRADIADIVGFPEFVVRAEPDRVVLRSGERTIAVSSEDVFEELFALVRARLEHRH